MALHNREEELLAAWRALADDGKGEGWRTIPIVHDCLNRVLAGRHFPGGEQALLIGFGAVNVPAADQLPKSHGFLVSKAELGSFNAGLDWIALRCQSPGRLDLFSLMAADVVSSVTAHLGGDEEAVLRAFLARIRAWQQFMRQTGDGVLAPEAEVGLIGELTVLRTLLSSGLLARTAVEAWQGPLGGLQDFVFATGAIEVKATASSGDFVVAIGSLEQLDDTQICPLFLAGIRFTLNRSGDSLPGVVAEVGRLLSSDEIALAVFQDRLLNSGYLDAFAQRYSRRFLCVEQRLIRVAGAFPRLTRTGLPLEIRSASYEIDIDSISTGDVGLSGALDELGAR